MNPSPSSFAPPEPLRGHPFRFGLVFLFLFSFLAASAQAQTAKSRSALYTEIDTNLPSTTGAITAAVLRAQLKNVVASAYNTVNADAQPIDADLTAIAALTTATYGRSLLTLADAAALRTTAALVIGTDVQAFDAELASIAALSSNGLIARTGAGSSAARTLTGTAAEITVTNGDGAAGNPTLSLPSALTFTGKTITGGTFASPTLTTPALGTPASGVGTNLTALNATQLTTGTIPAARLPTALTSINSITAATTTDLTLAGGSSGASLVLGQGTSGAAVLTTKGAGVSRAMAGSSATDAFYFTTSDYVALSAGSILRVAFGASTGNTYSALDAYSAGFGSTQPLVLSQSNNVLVGGTTNISGTGGLKVFGTTAATLGTITTGAFQTGGGASVTGNLNVGLDLRSGTGTDYAQITTSGGVPAILLRHTNTDRVSITANGDSTFNGGDVRIGNTNTALKLFVAGTTNSTNTTSGALQVAGGVGVAGAAYIGGQANLQAASPQIVFGVGSTAVNQIGFLYSSGGQYVGLHGNRNPSSGVFANTAGTHAAIDLDTGAAGSSITFRTTATPNTLGNIALFINKNGGIEAASPTGGIGYGTGAGGTVTQATSRTTGVTLNKVSGAITLFTAAGSTTPASFTVTNSAIAATDTVVLSVKSSTNKYLCFVTAVAAGSFEVTFYTTGGTASDAPVINFAVLKAVTS